MGDGNQTVGSGPALADVLAPATRSDGLGRATCPRARPDPSRFEGSDLAQAIDGEGPTSVRVGADDLALIPGRERPVGGHVDRVLEEMDRPVDEEEVPAARVKAAEGGVHPAGVPSRREA